MTGSHDVRARSSTTTDRTVGQLVTVRVGGGGFGLPIERVRDVFIIGAPTPVPLAPPAVAGLVNLRGRVVTALHLGALLGLGASADGAATAVGVEWRGEAFGLLVEAVGEVVEVDRSARNAEPSRLDPRLAGLARAVHRLADGLLVELDLDALLDRSLVDAASRPIAA